LIEKPDELSKKLNEITGIVAHGLFIGLADKIIMGVDGNTEIFTTN
jgi:ribose 5-phosphate isomerase A